eukprot:TRINITY_DN3097_c0_g1_i1.p1 TRINITY_DN3097_c0_g1~~TRINITY_DN3097_c0_g1_i1.p1  ORF type:complete len:724 (-),score=137.95 TRINITY_DN3097_c0_g1_i1:48-1907(-)
MSEADFWEWVNEHSALDPQQQTMELMSVLFHLADHNHNAKISFSEFLLFQQLMNSPDADYQLAFLIFNGMKESGVTMDNFVHALAKVKRTQLDLDSDFVRGFFGYSGAETLNYLEFTQLLKGMEYEALRQAFNKRAKVHAQNGEGSYITPQEFASIFKAVLSQRNQNSLPPNLIQNLESICGTDRVTYPIFIAFSNVITSFDRVHRAILDAAQQKQQPVVTRREFLRIARRLYMTDFTPLEAEFVFRIFDTDNDGLISAQDITTSVRIGPKPKVFATEKTTGTQMAKEALTHFVLGAVAGAIGAFAVYPIDLVKTRMQNQRSTDGNRLYSNSFDCFRKVWRGEGLRGLYKGLGPQLLGVAPEKAIKLTVNDSLRSMFQKDGGDVQFPLEVLAGGCAGASQVIFTNPIEIVKIRLQIQGESVKFGATPKSTVTIIGELGFLGLYKGASACLLRDVPFSAIYFPAYASLKQKFLSTLNEDSSKAQYNLYLLLAGALAGVPAASLVTPADVIKTRLQVEARKGQQTYTNIPDTVRKVWREEGFKAFWKGTAARVFRSSPQFGVTLLSYEILQSYLAPDLANPNPPTNAPIHPSDYARSYGEGVGRTWRRANERWGIGSGDDE